MVDSNQSSARRSIISGDQVTRVPGRAKDGPPGTGVDPTSRESVPDRYQYLAPISAGGMGSVHAVRDLGLLRIAAMKVLAPNLAASPREVQRFIREAQITAQLDHPNILPIYEVSESEDGLPFFSMKYATGGSLRDDANVESEGGKPPVRPPMPSCRDARCASASACQIEPIRRSILRTGARARVRVREALRAEQNSG